MGVRTYVSCCMEAISRNKTERPLWKMQAAVELVDAVLEADRTAPRKQLHAAHRIWEQIQHELPDCKIGERTVRHYVHSRKIALDVDGVARPVFPRATRGAMKRGWIGTKAYADLVGERIKAAGICDARHGQWSSIPLRLFACHPAGVSGSARTGPSCTLAAYSVNFGTATCLQR
jgi:hypothetical protein